MILAIDAGNTEIKLGCFPDAPGALAPSPVWRVATDTRRTADEYGVLFAQLFASDELSAGAVAAVAIASVVPALDPVLVHACRRAFGVEPRFLRSGEQCVMTIVTQHPAEVGADLVAAAIGARARFGAPAIVACFGTASVFIAISPAGEYAGYAIAPGIMLGVDALVARAAKLPAISLEAPERALGRNTVEAMRSGILYGFAGQIEGIVARMRAELGVPARVIATGGLAHLAAAQTALIDTVDPHLVLQGLKLFHEAVLH